MEGEERPKKKHKLLYALIIVLALSGLVLYVLDSFIYPKRVGVHFTNDPKERNRIARSEPRPEDEPVKKKTETSREVKIADPEEMEQEPQNERIKSIKEMASILKLSISSGEFADWDYNIERSAVKKLNKRIYSKAELEAWNVDMLGQQNAAKLSGGVEEILAKPEAEEKEQTADQEGMNDTELLNAALEEQGIEVEVETEETETPTPTAVDSGEKKPQKPKPQRMDPYSYKLTAFMPGLGSDGYFLDYEGVNYESAASGKPDFVDSRDDDPRMYREEFLPLGHGGIVEYQVIGGQITDGEGPDFVVYADSAFTDNVETAKVEVSKSGRPGTFIEFPCDFVNPPYRGCAGVHPVRAGTGDDPIKVGGDPFDLAKIGLSGIRFIRIVDTADNNNASNMPYTDGVDVDSIALIHAYKTQGE